MILALSLFLVAAAGAREQPPERAAPTVLSTDSLTLGACYRAAREHFPPVNRKRLYGELAELQAENVSVRLLPSIAASGRATYQSEVPQLPFQVPGAAPPAVAHDQYQAVLSVEQLIYDGGLVSAQRSAERAAIDAEGEQVEVEFHRRKEQINEAYFAALSQDAAMASLRSLSDEIRARRAALEAQIREGLQPGGRLDVLNVELLKIDQQLAGAEAARAAAIAALEILTGLEIPRDADLQVPQPAVGGDPQPVDASSAGERPEYGVFASSRALLERREDVAAIRNRPTVTGTAMAAVGRPPGLNIFENALSPYYTVGVAVRWPMWDWGKTRRDRQMLELRQEVVDAQEEAFTQNVRVVAERERREAARLADLLASDREIVALRERIAERAAGELENGVISATEYVVEQHAAQQARFTYDRHRIELAFARVRLLTILGRTDEMD